MHMRTSSYDILRTDARGNAVWIDAVPDIDAAKARVLHLAERFPADYVIFHRATVSVVANFHFKSTEFGSVASDIAAESLSSS
jgi:hypothetical protein